jgi:hypothetical protein
MPLRPDAAFLPAITLFWGFLEAFSTVALRTNCAGLVDRAVAGKAGLGAATLDPRHM